MARSDKLRNNLPFLYRPEPGSQSLLNRFLEAVGYGMDEAQQRLTQVMQSHWYAYADKASFDEHALRDRERRGLPPFNVRDPKDQLEIHRYPYIQDLARLGKLVGLPPWKEPPNQSDLVENYRRRLSKIMQIYRRGQGTLDALRTIVEAELPWTLENPLPERIRSFALEEGYSAGSTKLPVVMDGSPPDKVGALMRWQISRGDALPVRPTVLIHGIAAAPDETEVTESPLIERYEPESNGLIGIGVAFLDTVPEGKTLRLSPTRRSWLGATDGLRESPLTDDGNGPSDASANGPWTAAAGTPEIAVEHILRSACGCLWAAGEQQLWRHDGRAFTRILEDRPFADILCLFEFRKRLFIGCEDGLFVTQAYPTDGERTRSAFPELNGVAVHQILEYAGEVWLATGSGPRRMNVAPDESVTFDPVLLEVPTYSLLFDDRVRYFGCELGLLRLDPAAGQWHAYRGETDEEPQTLWQPVDPNSLPAAADLALPPIRSMAVTADQALWLGADEGLCRYYARHERDLLYRATLEAYADLIPGPVHHLLTDERGMLWIASGQGLFRYDGRDIAQYRSVNGHWQQMGRADSLYPNEIAPEPRGQWRFNRHEGAWEQFAFSAARWMDETTTVRSAAEDPVNCALVTDSLLAHIGTWDGTQFTAESPVPPDRVRMRCKPDPTTIVDGGLPFIPRLPSAHSTWRYLQLEPEAVTPPPAEGLPWWTREGRLFPPPEMADVHPGRYRTDPLAIDGRFDESVFAYLPSARVTMVYGNPLALSVCVRLFKRTPQDAIDPAIVERVFRGIEHVRPAGVPVTLAVEGKIVKGEIS